MAAQKLLFDDICEFSQGGIKRLFLSTYINKPEPYYPLDFYVSGQTVSTINENIIFSEIAITDNAKVEQKRINDNQGKWYSKELTFQIKKYDLQTTRFFTGVLFKKTIVNPSGIGQDVNVVNYNTTAIFQDMNDFWWISGYDIPFKITKFEITTGEDKGENGYSLGFLSRSYDRIRAINPVIDCKTITYYQS